MSTTGGFEGYVQMRGSGSLRDMEDAANKLVLSYLQECRRVSSSTKAIGMVRNLFSTGSPQLYANLDRERCKTWASPLPMCILP